MGRLACCNFVSKAPEGINVDILGVLSATIELWCLIEGRSNPRFAPNLPVLLEGGHAQVRNFYCTLTIYQNVSRLQISVNDLLLVHELDSGCHAVEHILAGLL